MKNTRLFSVVALLALLFVGCNRSANEQALSEGKEEKGIEVAAETITNDQLNVNKANLNVKNAKKADADCYDRLIVKEYKHIVWTGVDSCCKGNRPAEEIAAVFKDWIDQEKNSNPDYEVGNTTRGAYQVSCRQSDGGLGGKDECSGRVDVTFSINFLKYREEPLEYKYPATAIKQTDWISNPADPSAETGFIKKGEQVDFSQNLGRDLWQEARLANGKVVFVHPLDFE